MVGTFIKYTVARLQTSNDLLQVVAVLLKDYMYSTSPTNAATPLDQVIEVSGDLVFGLKHLASLLVTCQIVSVARACDHIDNYEIRCF